MDPLNFAKVMKIEAEFKGGQNCFNLRITFNFNTGISSELVPWIDNAEKFTSDTLEKPKSIVVRPKRQKRSVFCLLRQVCLADNDNTASEKGND